MEEDWKILFFLWLLCAIITCPYSVSFYSVSLSLFPSLYLKCLNLTCCSQWQGNKKAAPLSHLQTYLYLYQGSVFWELAMLWHHRSPLANSNLKTLCCLGKKMLVAIACPMAVGSTGTSWELLWRRIWGKRCRRSTLRSAKEAGDL